MSIIEEHEKYKDDQPLNTVQRIRRILHNLGILTVEQWFKAGDSLYSVRVMIAGTDIGQNGKGTSEAYALASAYGEFMERLQLGTLYNGAELGPAALAAEGFYYAPDEEYASVEQVLTNGGPVVDHLLTARTSEQENSSGLETLLEGKLAQWYGEDDQDIKRALLKEWDKETPEDCPSDFVCLPYYSLKKKQLFAIPLPMLRLPYLHNGAAAGNSPEEALVQAMSEILERYVHKKIITGKVTPPDIPLDYLEQNSRLAGMVKEIENQGYHVMMKDCSLNLGIPIVGVVIVDQRVSSYFVKFGVHPSFKVALERCLTEVAQGRDIFGSSRDWMTRFQYHDEGVHRPQNTYNILRFGIGSYPASFLAANSTQFLGYPELGPLSNKELLKLLTDILLKISEDVLIRDVSYLGFPAYQVLAPGVSEIFEYDGARLSLERLRKEVGRIMRNLRLATNPELHKVVSFLVKRAGFGVETTYMDKLTGIPARSDFPWNRTPIAEFMSAALYKMGKVSQAAAILKQFVQDPGVKAVPSRDRYYSAVRDYLFARAEGKDERELQSFLAVFHGFALVTTVVEQWGDPAKVLDKFEPLPCWDCQVCTMRDRCSGEKLAAIHMRFKKQQAGNPLDQRKLQQIFVK